MSRGGGPFRPPPPSLIRVKISKARRNSCVWCIIARIVSSKILSVFLYCWEQQKSTLKGYWSSGTHSFIITEPQKYDSKLISTVKLYYFVKESHYHLSCLYKSLQNWTFPFYQPTAKRNCEIAPTSGFQLWRRNTVQEDSQLLDWPVVCQLIIPACV